MTNEYQILINRLKVFVQKFYKNEIWKGLLLLVITFTISIITVSVIEYFGNFSIPVRASLFYIFILANLYIIFSFIANPLLRLFQLKKPMSTQDAGKIIATHFSEVNDKITNVIELAEMKHPKSISYDLVLASINNKINTLSPFNFEYAIDINTTRKFMYRSLLALALFAVLFISSPNIFKQGTTRVFKYSTPFLPQAPFTFELMNDSLQVEKGKDYTVQVEVNGSYIPSEVYISMGGANYLMEKLSTGKFKYSIKNANNSLDFHFKAEEFQSDIYQLKVLPSPLLLNMVIKVDVPDYTGEKDFTVQQNGDLTIPVGSRISWNFLTDNTQELSLIFDDSIPYTLSGEKQNFTFNRRAVKNEKYAISIKNKYFNNNHLSSYIISVIPDLFPSILSETMPDSIRPGVFYFRGKINDDYGFSKLTFNYNPENKKDSIVKVEIPISMGTNAQDFYFMYDFSQLIASGASFDYFFEVWDNDAVNGKKSARTQIEKFTIPDAKELEKTTNETEKSLDKALHESEKISEKIRNDIKKLQQDMLNTNMTQWEKTQKLNAIMEQYKNLENKVNTASKEFNKRNEMLNTFTEQDKAILEKQQQIEELLENLLDDELKKMMEELKNLMDNFDKNKINEMAEKLDMRMEDVNKELDRNLELLKRLKVEESIDKLANQMKELAEEQDKLSEETKEFKGDTKELEEKQNKISNDFNKIMEEYKQTQEENKSLEKPMPMPDQEMNESETKNEMNKANESLQQKNQKSASKSQKNAANQMKKMSAEMQQQMQSSCSGGQQEDMDQLRHIMDNLLKYSFSQEQLMKDLAKLNSRDVKYMDKMNEQKKLNDDFSVIRDSLYALSKRTPQISSVINKEVRSIVSDGEQVMEQLDARQIGQVRSKQQFIMTSANNLALLLDEILDQMIKQSQEMKSNSSCNKPGNGAMSLQQMKSLQQSLKAQMESMIEQLKDQQGKDGKGKSGKDGKGMSEQLGKMLAEQEKFRQMLGEFMQSGGLSPETSKKLNEINQLLEEVEKDIVQRNVSTRTIQRQEQILTRLLEAEKSEYQRDTDIKRESKSGQNKEISNPEEIFKYKGLPLQLNESINENKIKLVKFYNNKYKEYLNNLNK